MWLLVLAAEVLAIDLPVPLELCAEPVEITLISPDNEDSRRLLDRVAADPTENLVLRLSNVEADAASSVSWEIHLASLEDSADDTGSSPIGILSPYGLQPNAEFVYSLKSLVGVRELRGLKLKFLPVSGLEEQVESVPASIRGNLRIGGISLETETAAGRNH